MKRNSLMRALCAMLILALLPCAGVSEGKGRLGYVSANLLRVYDRPDRSAKALSELGYGQELWVNDWSNGWAQVSSRSGAVGYCELSGLSAKDPNTLGEEAYVRVGGATAYAKPSAKCKSRAKLAAGTRLWAVARTKDKQWVRVQRGGAYGYVRASDLSRTEQEKSVWVVANEAVAVLDDAGGELGICSQGQTFKLVSVSGRRAQIRTTSGRTGWVDKSVLSTDNPNKLATVAYTQVSGELLWKNAQLKGTVRTLKKGAKVEIVSRTPDGQWCRVRSGGKFGYILSVLLDTQKPGKEALTLRSTVAQPLYATPVISNDIRAQLKPGEKVELLSLTISGTGLKLRTKSGTTGYAPTSAFKS